MAYEYKEHPHIEARKANGPAVSKRHHASKAKLSLNERIGLAVRQRHHGNTGLGLDVDHDAPLFFGAYIHSNSVHIVFVRSGFLYNDENVLLPKRLVSSP